MQSRQTIEAELVIEDEQLRYEAIRAIRYFGVTPMQNGSLIAFSYYGEAETVEDLREFAETYSTHSIHTRVGR